jgi:hypothetical protein
VQLGVQLGMSAVGSSADIHRLLPIVSFTPKSGHQAGSISQLTPKLSVGPLRSRVSRFSENASSKTSSLNYCGRTMLKAVNTLSRNWIYTSETHCGVVYPPAGENPRVFLRSAAAHIQPEIKLN